MLGFGTGWKDPNSVFSHTCSQLVTVVRPSQGFLRFSAGSSETLLEPSPLLGNLLGAPAQPRGDEFIRCVLLTKPWHPGSAAMSTVLWGCPWPSTIPPHHVPLAGGGLTPPGCQVTPQSHSVTPQLDREEKIPWKAHGSDKDREASLTSYHHRPN